jgi:hypothetical protein
MKSKRKLDLKVIKQFFIEHTEKIVIALVGLLFLYFTYSAVMLQANESYKKDPKNLTDVVQAAKKTMEIGPTSKTPAVEAPIPAYANITEQFKRPLDIKEYPPVQPWDQNVIAPRNPRGTPAVVPVEGLRAVAGRGAMGSKDSSGGSVGQRWIVVTGLVPYAKQLAEYKNQFDLAGVQSDHDIPEYVGFLVKRVEIQPGASGEPNWENAVTYCNVDFLTRQVEKWSGTAPEVVDLKYVMPSLTSQLPARAIGDWGDEVAHPSEIKVVLLEERDQMQAAAGQMNQPGRFSDGRGRAVPPPKMMDDMRRRRLQLGAGGRGAVAPNAGGGVDDVFGRKEEGANDAANNKVADEGAQVPPYFLLRYFDFDVEPGKQYAYRVFPLLKNPNSFVSVNDLADASQGAQQLLGVVLGKERPDANNKIGDLKIAEYWSNTCQTSRLPGDTRVIAGSIEPAKTPSPTEINGDVRILKWDEATGANTNFHREGQYRGMVLNYEDVDVQPGPTRLPKLETNAVLVDMTGADPMSPPNREKIHGYGAMLLLDEAGNLVISDETRDTKEWIAETKVPEQPNPIAGGEGRRYRGDRGPGGRPRGGTREIRPPSSDSSLPDGTDNMKALPHVGH